MNGVSRPPSEPFLGRVSELTALVDAYRAAAQGSSRVVLVTGEAGIGKSRLVREFLRTTVGEEVLVATGAAYGEAESEPLGPIVRALRGLTGDVAEEMRPRLEHVIAMLASPDAAAGDGGAGTRSHLFDLVGSGLRELATLARLRVIVLEDLHWADSSTLEFLLQVARRLSGSPLLIVATSRWLDGPDTQLTALADTLRREFLAIRVDLRGLNEGEARSLVADMSSEPLASDTLASLLERCDGNPLFLIEAARSRGAGVHRVPPVIGELVRYHLAGLPTEVRDVAMATAVLGQQATIESVAALLQRPVDVVGPAAERLIHEQLATPEDRVLVFWHALIRDAVYEAIPLSRRSALHVAAADLVERRGGSPSVIAGHLEASGVEAESVRADRYSLLAAERALELRAYEAAIEWTERALERGGGGLERPVQLDLLLTRADAHRQMSAHVPALRDFERAAELANASGLAEREARAAIGYEQTFMATGRGRSSPDLSTMLLDRALEGLGPDADDADLAVRTLAACAQAHYFSGEAAVADALSARAVAVAAETGAKRAEPWALEARRLVLWGADALEERRSLTERIVGGARLAGDRERLADGLYWGVWVSLETGDLDRAVSQYEELRDIAAELGHLRRQAEATRIGGMLAVLRGRRPEASAYALEARQMAAAAGNVDAALYYVALIAIAEPDAGVRDRTVGEVLSDATAWHSSPTHQSMKAYLNSVIGRADEARKLVTGLAERGFTDEPRGPMWLAMLTLLGETASGLGEPRWAEQLFHLLQPYEGRFVVNSNAVCYGSIDRVLGLLAAQFDLEAAERHLRRAVADNASMGATLWEAESLRRLVELREASGRREASVAAAGTGHALTRRETEVLGLLAAGQSNQEIADELVLSVRTVERHVANIYTKIDAHGRAEAAAFALRHGVIT